jgi:hypothetical protein
MTMTTETPTPVRYVEVVFMEGDDAYDLLDQLTRVDGVVMHGSTDDTVADAVRYLADWDYGQETTDAHTRDTEPWGKHDDRATVGNYVLSWNYNLAYVSLTRVEHVS